MAQMYSSLSRQGVEEEIAQRNTLVSLIMHFAVIFIKPFCLETIGNECESCGETGTVWCTVCRQTRCDMCDKLWHKHPSRRDHNREVCYENM